MIENRDDLGNAIALNSSMFNAARLLGPAVAGILIAAFGECMCFLIIPHYMAFITFTYNHRVRYDNANGCK